MERGFGNKQVGEYDERNILKIKIKSKIRFWIWNCKENAQKKHLEEDGRQTGEEAYLLHNKCKVEMHKEGVG